MKYFLLFSVAEIDDETFFRQMQIPLIWTNFNNNTRPTSHTIVSWTYPKQWLMIQWYTNVSGIFHKYTGREFDHCQHYAYNYGNAKLLRPSDAYMRQLTNHHWFRQWLVAWPAPSHYLNQCWNIVNWIPRNKLQWNFDRNSYIFHQENPFENVVWKMAAILSRPQCVMHCINQELSSSLWYKPHLSRQLNCGSLRCSWSIACRRCSNYIFILDLTPGFNGSGKDNCKTRRESFKFWDLVRIVLEILPYIMGCSICYWKFFCGSDPGWWVSQQACGPASRWTDWYSMS